MATKTPRTAAPRKAATLRQRGASGGGIETKVAHGIGVIWLARAASGNTLSAVEVRALIASLQDLASRTAVRAVVLAAQGEQFCTGSAAGKRGAPDEASMRLLLDTLAGLDKPTLARVQGDAFGLGLALIAACDIAVAATGVNFGIGADIEKGRSAAVTAQLAQALGSRAASRYLLTGETFDSSEAYRLGLVQELTPVEALDGTLNLLLGHLVQREPAELASIKARRGRRP